MSPAKIIKLDRESPAADFRGAMRHLVGAVSVITVGRGDDVTGMTVTSVSSLAVDPPSLIVSVNRSASSCRCSSSMASSG
jgi:flavin reductase (DIM6/NTAB) family NADH-FMN oxidoreductase RutF